MTASASLRAAAAPGIGLDLEKTIAVDLLVREYGSGWEYVYGTGYSLAVGIGDDLRTGIPVGGRCDVTLRVTGQSSPSYDVAGGFLLDLMGPE